MMRSHDKTQVVIKCKCGKGKQLLSNVQPILVINNASINKSKNWLKSTDDDICISRAISSCNSCILSRFNRIHSQIVNVNVQPIGCCNSFYLNLIYNNIVLIIHYQQ